MKNALIGYSGFVGSNLLSQGNFSNLYNSSNITSIEGNSFNQVWCAGVKAVKWWANVHPDEDKKGIETLLSSLDKIHCDHFILISTVDVFREPCGVDETMPPSEEGLSPYGLHRLEVEAFVAQRFPSHTIVRLPGLFGNGLKKNIIYDLAQQHEVHKIHSDGVFQFYDLKDIHRDCNIAINANLKVAHLAVEPTSVTEIAASAFNISFDNKPEGQSPAKYDMHTAFAELWGKKSPYIQTKGEVLNRIREFVISCKKESH